MIEIYPKLFIGNQAAYESDVKFRSDWSVVHACKEPYHREALGYTGRGAPKDATEYLFARRDNRLILNMVDTPKAEFIPKGLVDEALKFIQEQLSDSKKVLVHCNQGKSRSPGIGLLYLVKHTDKLPKGSFAEAEQAFRNIYPCYNPAGGVRGFMQVNWESYTK